MRSHVEPVGKERHRAIDEPRRDLDDHHDRSEGDDDDGASLTTSPLVLVEDVIVGGRADPLFLHRLLFR